MVEVPEWSYLGRLVYDLAVSADSPVIRGTRVTASRVISLIIDGRSWADILRAYPELTEEDIRACLVYSIGGEEDEFDPSHRC